MCGIAGFIDTRAPQCDWLKQNAMRMGKALAHRGPDAGGEWIDPDQGVAFAHRRLSIIDLSPAGAQPMVSASGRFVICYNGEVYNALDIHAEIAPQLAHDNVVLRGHCDTEIILEAVERLGVKSTCERLIGMFAFGLWDRREKKLWLVRDRLGIKPLYFAHLPKGKGPSFCFASELKAIKAYSDISLDIDRDAVAGYLRFNYVPAPRTIYRHIEKLTPGSILEVDCHGSIVGRESFWSLDEVVRQGASAPFEGTQAEATDALESLLADAVSSRMVSDVPLGAFLSGGIDSSTVVALMQKVSARPIRSYSIGFAESEFDESSHARLVAQHLGTDHTELRVTPNEACDAISDLPQIFDEPFADSSQIPTLLLSRLTREHVTVALSGDGGDELFAGYNRYLYAVAMARRLASMPGPLLKLARTALETPAPRHWDRLFQALPQAWRPLQATDRITKLASILGEKDDGIYRRLVSHWPNPDDIARGGYEPKGIVWDETLPSRMPRLLDRMRYLDTMTYLPDDILTKVDRASMSTGLEVRVPLLDHRLVDFAWRLPPAFLVQNRKGKSLLRRVLHRHVPRDLVDRPKMGFGIPLGDWLRGPLRIWADSLLTEECFARHGLLNAARVRHEWENHLLGKVNRQHELWGVLMLHAWAEHQSET